MTIQPEAAPLTIYICGPMTGIADSNYPAFNAADQQLQAAGYGVLNPVQGSNDAAAPRPYVLAQGGDWSDYMRNALNQVIRADHVALLPNWEMSKGARLERMIAGRLGMICRPLDAWIGLAPTGYGNVL